MITVKFDEDVVKIEILTEEVGRISVMAEKDLTLAEMEIKLMEYAYKVVENGVQNFLKQQKEFVHNITDHEEGYGMK